MDIQIDVRAAEVLLKLRNGEKRMVYAVANGVRDTALDVQKAIRESLPSRFTLRNQKEFLLRQAAVITLPRPGQGIVEARVRVGEKKGLFLASYERGFLRQPAVGRRVAVPEIGGARPSQTAPIPPELYVRQLDLRPRGTPASKGRGRRRKIRRGAGPIEGRQGTFLIPGVGIFQRLGGIKRILYVFARPFQQAPRLGFIATAQKTVRERFRLNLAKAIADTLEFNKNR
jgi:hypothetical protein